MIGIMRHASRIVFHVSILSVTQNVSRRETLTTGKGGVGSAYSTLLTREGNG